MASTDRAALVALYNAISGAFWTIRTNWSTYAPLGQWYGVKVNYQGRVVELELAINNLQGIYFVRRACCRLPTCSTFPRNSLTDSGPFIKLQVLQQATTFSISYVPSFCTRSTP